MAAGYRRCRVTDMAHIQAVVRQNPRRPNEGAVQFIQRIAVLAGLIRPEETAGEPPQGWHDAATVMREEREEYWNR